ncbi:MAG: M23 family metallopeptidase [Bacilli bacterium]|nr:M23 family metallopeptidase [Bacilli bacterium]
MKYNDIKKKEIKNNNYIKNIFYNGLFVIVLVLFGTLITSKNEILKANIYKNIYNDSINFAEAKKIYNKYAGSVIPFENIIKEKEVFNESLKYNEVSNYDEGVKLSLDSNYSIPILSDGIVIFIGNKDNLNKTVIIEDENGIDHYYGNLDTVNVKIYDYVSKNDLLGTAKDNTLYLLFSKDGKYLDYKEFLK